MSKPRCLAALVILSLTPVLARAEVTRGADHIVIEGQRIPFGTSITVEGPCLTTDSFNLLYSYGAASQQALRINGKATRDALAFYLTADRAQGEAGYKSLKAMEPKTYYRIRGRLTDARVTRQETAVNLVVESLEAIPPSPLKFEEFVDRDATFEGIAAARGGFQTQGELASLAGVTEWPSGVEGKAVRLSGILRRLSDNWQFEKPEWSLVLLVDQIDQPVSLEGSLRSLNDHWWFQYRNERLVLATERGTTMSFPTGDFGRQVRVTGKLIQQLRPSLAQISLKSDRDLVPSFVIRGAKAEYLDQQLSWHQRFGAVYPTFHKVSDGVPELLAESSYRRNIVGNETTAGLYIERNYDVIQEILRQPTAATRDVLARRMRDAQLPEPIRLIYAAMLAAVNDERGRLFLSTAAEAPIAESLPNVIYCLGTFPFLLRGDAKGTSEVNWAEKTLVALMSNKKSAPADRRNRFAQRVAAGQTVADLAVETSQVPQVLMLINSPAARSALLNYATAKRTNSGEVIQILCNGTVPLPVDDLLRLEAVTTEPYSRRAILGQLLRQKHRAAVDLFQKDLEDGFVYMDFRDHSSSEVNDALRSVVANLKGEAYVHARMLITLSAKDPIPELIAMLEDPKWNGKTRTISELSRLHDPRTLGPVIRILRESPADYFGTGSKLIQGIAVKNSLEAIAKSESPQAVNELIELFAVDLSRFETYIDREGYRRLIAAHLIELTGESFGTDAAAWQAWLRKH